MTCFYRASAADFLATSDEHVLAQLGIAYANRGYTSQYSDQTLTWERDLNSLRNCLGICIERSGSARLWGVLLEFSIPRKEMRIDLVLLVRDAIVVIEAKSEDAGSQAKRQIEEYSLLLHYFHKESSNRKIVPIIVSSAESNIDFNSLNQRASLKSRDHFRRSATRVESLTEHEEISERLFRAWDVASHYGEARGLVNGRRLGWWWPRDQ